MSSIDSSAPFRPHRFCLIGLGGPFSDRIPFKYRRIYAVYSVTVISLFIVGYPLHLMASLFRNATQADDIRNLAISLICLSCSLKYIAYIWKLPQLRQMEQIFAILDKRVEEIAADRKSFRELQRKSMNVSKIFIAVLVATGLSATLGFALRDQRSLLYPAWMPIAWADSQVNFIAANVYQFMGLVYLLIVDYVVDSMPPMVLCLLTGHVQLLINRISRIGYGRKGNRSVDERNFKQCINDQQLLYELFTLIQRIISLPMLWQFTVIASNICLCFAALLFFVTSVYDRLYYVMCIIALPLQIYPTCYYGSEFEMRLGQLHSAAYNSNWIAQSRSFRKDMILFAERSLKQHTAMAGGLVAINLLTFLSVCKGTYSLFALVAKMKD